MFVNKVTNKGKQRKTRENIAKKEKPQKINRGKQEIT